MAKRILLDFLQYLFGHQNSNDNYFNHYFVIRACLIKEHDHFGFTVDKAKEHLIKAGYIQGSADARPLQRDSVAWRRKQTIFSRQSPTPLQSQFSYLS